MADITLYIVHGSCSMAARILLKELQIPFNLIQMTAGPDGYEAADGSLSNAAYKQKLHPSGYVPALSLANGIVIAENPAILTYIAALHPERELLGTSPIDKARVLEWLVWLSGTLHSLGYGAFWRPMRFTDDEAAFESIKKRGHENVLRCFARIEERVDGEKHAVGEKLTVVDIFLHTFYRWGNMISVDVNKYPRYREVMREVEKLESVQAAMKEEGFPLLFPDA